jgi:hypothetical protein
MFSIAGTAARRLPKLRPSTIGVIVPTARRSRAHHPSRDFHLASKRAAVVQPAPSASSYLENLPGSFLKQPTGNIKKVLVVGSGGLAIGQAGEFDYSGEYDH